MYLLASSASGLAAPFVLTEEAAALSELLDLLFTIPVSTFALAGKKSLIILNKELSKKFNSLIKDLGDLVNARVSSQAASFLFHSPVKSSHCNSLLKISFFVYLFSLFESLFFHSPGRGGRRSGIFFFYKSTNFNSSL